MEMKKNMEFFKRFAKYGMGAWAVGWNPVAQRLVHRAMMKHKLRWFDRARPRWW